MMLFFNKYTKNFCRMKRMLNHDYNQKRREIVKNKSEENLETIKIRILNCKY